MTSGTGSIRRREPSVLTVGMKPSRVTSSGSAPPEPSFRRSLVVLTARRERDGELYLSAMKASNIMSGCFLRVVRIVALSINQLSEAELLLEEEAAEKRHSLSCCTSTQAFFQ